MSRLPQSHFDQHHAAPRPRGNSLGVAGFVLTIIGLIGCCIPPVLLLGVIGGILCFFGLFRSPRGLAIAGFILALFQTAIFTVLLLIVGGAMFAVQELPGYFRSIVTVFEVGQKVEEYRIQNGTLPTSLDQLTGVTTTDGWGNALIYDLDSSGNAYRIISAGPDGVADTDDDLEFDSEFFSSMAGSSGATSFPMPPVNGESSGNLDGETGDTSNGTDGEDEN